ncbi:hypothetical protein Tsubulata_011977 [Turnera subulata]|uniref:Zinc knuckle CX2CX4HX4C domain-containing protein n=1 Tax=Turnera subulata TaxID=218843 RepID=A0A9Q0J781_9ROSI|nr:hypothetical protein Tsubulata_011977 [Turnera subulata]
MADHNQLEDEVEGHPIIVPSAKEQAAVVFEDDEGETGPTELTLCLVGSLWTDRPFNVQAFMRTMRQLDPNRGLGQGKFIRFRTVKDVRTPILRGSTVILKDGKETWIYYKYERLPFFCCGRIGNIAKDCSHVDDDDLLNPALYQYGEELMASPLRRPVLFHGERTTDRVRRKLVFKPSRVGGTSSEGLQSRSESRTRVKKKNSESHNGTTHPTVNVEIEISSKFARISGEDVVIITDRPEVSAENQVLFGHGLTKTTTNVSIISSLNP